MVEETASRPALDTPRVLDELSRSNSARISSKARRQRVRVVLVLIILIPFLFGIAYAVYGQWRTQNLLADLRWENQQLREAQANAESQFLALISRINNQLGDLAAESGSGEQLLTGLREDFSGQLQSLEESVQLQQRQLRNLQNQDVQWLYQESEHLLRLASRKTQLERDVSSARVLLDTVESMLRELEGSGVAALRQSLAEDQRALQAAEVPDIAGSYLALAQLAESVQSLSTATALRDAYEEQLVQRQNPQPAAADDGLLASGMNLLASIFVWRDWDDAPAVVLPPQEEYYIKQNLVLLLEQAQTALLSRQESLYRNSLQRSIEWLNRYQLDETRQGQIMAEELAELQMLEMTPVLPDFANSLRLVAQLRSGADIVRAADPEH